MAFLNRLFGNSPGPSDISKLKNEARAVSVVGSQYRSLALLDNGMAIEWGGFEKKVSIRARGVKAIAGCFHFVVLEENGTVQAWGGERNYLCKVPKEIIGVTAVAAAPDFTALLLGSRNVLWWGNIPYFLKPENEYPTFRHTLINPTDIVAIAGGRGFIAFLQVDGTILVRSCQDNMAMQFTQKFPAKAIAASDNRLLVINQDGSVSVFQQYYFSLLPKNDTPEELAGVKAIAAGQLHTTALKEAGSVVVWGDGNIFNQCTIPAGLKKVKAIGTGWDRTIAITEDGKVVAWGKNDGGQCDVPDILR